MGFLSRMFRQTEDVGAMPEHIRLLLDDDACQVERAPAALRDMLRSAPAYDADPGASGPFGLVATNPIPVNGPFGELAYLSRLETQSGQRLLFHRLGSMTTTDVFEAVSLDGSQWFLFFLDMYHSRRSRRAPDGLGFTQETARFSGLNNLCDRFPYDFAEKASNIGRDLNAAYIPIGMIAAQMSSRVYNRSLAHKVKLDLIRPRLTAYQFQ